MVRAPLAAALLLVRWHSSTRFDVDRALWIRAAMRGSGRLVVVYVAPMVS